MRKKLLSLFVVLVCAVSTLIAQNISDTYQFVYVGGTFTALSGGTPISLAYNGSANTDDGYANIPIGFTFNYGGTNYTTINVDANGWASFGAAIPNNSDTWDNNLATGPAGGTGSRPVLAPLWDDLYTDPGTVTYQVNGSSPNRTLTIEFKNIYWTWAASTPVMSFQIVLHETSNIIDFVYRSESGAYGDDGTHGASIGISGTTSGDFLSVTPNGILTSATSAVENSTITTKPASGTTVSFIPYCSAGIQPTYIGQSESISRVRIGSIDQSTPATPPTAYHNYTNLYTFAQAGASIPITINAVNSYSLDQVYIWIDFNHNGSFTDPGEEVYISTAGVDPATITTNLAIPAFSASVLSGPTRMRIRLNDTGSPPDNSTPCGSGGLFGDVQDFTINLQSCISAIILAQPAATTTVCNGGNGTVAVNAIGTGLTYQWQLSTDGGTTYNNLTDVAPYSGTATGTLAITAATPAMAGYKYRVVLNGTCTSPSVTSNASTLAINTPPTVITQPANKTVCPTNTAAFSFTVAATGTTPTYQWQVSTDGGTTYSNIAGQTATSLTFTTVTTAMNGNKYRAVVSVGSCTSVNSNAATLTVDLPTVTLASPITAVMPAASAVITATSVPAAASYAWTFNGSPIAATTNPITPDIAATGTYKVTVTDVNGCVNTSAGLTITAAPTTRLYVYPNPNKGQFQLRLYSDNIYLYDEHTITIYDASGNVLLTKIVPITSQYVQMNFDLTGASAGVYMVKITHRYTGSPVVTGRFVIAN